MSDIKNERWQDKIDQADEMIFKESNWIYNLIITISSGAFILSINKLIDMKITLNYGCLIILSWAFFILTILFCITAGNIRLKLLSKKIYKYMSIMLKDKKSEVEYKKKINNLLNRHTKVIWAFYICFFIALIFMFLFVISNLCLLNINL